MPVLADATIRERTLGSPPFAIFIDSGGSASGAPSYPALDSSGNPVFAVIAAEPACPTGGFTITLTNPQGTASQTRTLPCRVSLASAAPVNPSPTPNVPVVTPTALLFHWPADEQQQFVATEWGYTHWFAASQGFSCGSGVADFPNVLPSPYSTAYSKEEAALAPSPPPQTPFSYPNSGGASTNDAPATFPLRPQSAGICSAAVQDDFGQSAATSVAVMGWLTASYGGATATHGSGSIAIPPGTLAAKGSSATISLAKSFDASALAPRITFTEANASACANDLSVATTTGSTPSAPSSTPATGGVTLIVAAIPPSSLSCSGVIYNHYSDPAAPSDAVSESGEGVPFTASLSPATGPLSTLGEIVFWLASGSGGECSYAQLFLQGGGVDANAPNSTDAFNATDSNGCVTNKTVSLWATESHYSGNFSVAAGSCGGALAFGTTSWPASGASPIAASQATPACTFDVQSSDQNLSNGGAKSVAAVVNPCGGSSMTVGIGSGCEFTMPLSSGNPPDCTPGGSGGELVTVKVTESPDPMLGTLSLVSSNGVQGTYLWTRTAEGTQTISYTESVVLCPPGHSGTSRGSYTFD